MAITLTSTYQRLSEVWIGHTGYCDVYVRVYGRVSSEGYDIENNKTKVYAKSTVYLSVGSFTDASNGTKSVSCTGLSTVSGGSRGTFYAGETDLCETSGYVQHNNDGTKSVTISGRYYSSYFGWDGTASATVNLPTIPRASSFTFSGNTLGSAIKVNISRASESFTHKVQFAYENSGYSDVATNISTSASFTPATATYAAQTPNSTSGTGYIKVLTYSGSTLIGEKITTFSCNIPSSVIPTISSISLIEGNDIPSGFDCFIKNKSKLEVNVIASGIYGSSIKNYSIKINGSLYNANNITTDLLSTSGSNNCEVVVTDSRGRTSSTFIKSYEVVDYENPVITKLTAERQAIETNVLVTMSASISSVNNKNSKKFILKYKKHSASTYTTATTITDSYSINNLTYTLTGISDSESYDVLFEAVDSFTTSFNSRLVSTTFSLMNFGSDGTGIAFGKASEASNTFECALDMECTNLNVSGTLTNSAITNIVANNKNALINLFYPVGSYYETSSTTFDPNTSWYGTWKLDSVGRVTVSYDSSQSEFNTVGKTGGSKYLQSHTHTGTTSVNGEHTHTFNGWWTFGSGYFDGAVSRSRQSDSAITGPFNPAGAHSHTFTTDSAGSGNSGNLQPYIVVRRWHRTG